MPKEVVIVGAVALGPKVACRLRRLDPEANITLIDRDNLISYGGCGIPYYVGGDVNDLEDLYKTSSHAVRDKEFFKTCKGINVLTRVEATEIDRFGKNLKVKHLESGEEESLTYDKLVIATGASPVIPPFPGADLPRVFTVADLHDAEKIKSLMARGKVGKAVVIGAGAIGLEISEALTDLWGIETTLIEMEDQVMPTLLGKCIARLTAKEMEKKGVTLLLSERVLQITEDSENNQCVVKTSHNTFSVDIVVLAAGVRPNTELAKNAGISVGMSGGIAVDRRMRTSDPNIYAGGDCVELRNLVSGENMLMALGSLANRQGRVIATNISGGQSHFQGTVGTFCIKVFDLGISKAGLTYRQAKLTGFDPVYAVVSQADHAHFYPSSEMIYISLIADRRSRKIIGIEAAGKNGDAVKARVDTIAVLLRHGVDVDEVCGLETGYAPPFASAMDVINNAGNALDNILAGHNRPVDAADFLFEFAHKDIKVLDMRGEKEAAPFIEKYGVQWLNIPQDQLRSRVSEVPTDEPLFLLCDTGPRSYEAQVYLTSRGITNTYNIQGGFAMIVVTDPEFI
ncbi:MAG: pyridine nucleotide-disulfide oxidoreductase [Desulfobulbaceae bacterium S3730MH12]|nr:MAG: pyridine nucleotide-disulfide oxidoreductase [Desulfobulbaceae bacterium S5133MH15]OEU55955.1 MAG: pyridine nucleotide-disulfide oxidoreductase [Desulfobulbaceae bacterium S3730MH12]OEU82904.1 MAG: pyridine nucleotide-disulfide oxidoreductase [Desulfobulbaceae bacterium C00003063]